MKRLLSAGIIGTILEWYDFSIYVYLAPIIAKLFFSSTNAYASLILTYLVFAMGYMLRPLGGVIFGHIGDKYGRKITFTTTIILMSVATFMIGLLPDHNKIGGLAIGILILFRLLQGLAVGGELVGTIIYFFEISPTYKRSFNSTFIWIGSGAGVLLSSLVIAILSALLTSEQLQSWGWRIPFLMGIFTGFIGYFLRKHAPESPEYIELKTREKLLKFPFWEILKLHKLALLRIIAIFAPIAISFYLIFVFLPVFVSQFANFPLHIATSVNSVNLLLLLLAGLLVAYISDRVNKKILLIAGLIGFIGFGWPAYALIMHGTIQTLFLGQFMFVLISACYLGPLIAFTLEATPANIRYSITAIGINISYSVLGGSAPAVATFLTYKFNSHIFPTIYLILAATVALFAIISVQYTRSE